MSYIGSNPILQFFKEGTDSFAVSTSQSVFILSRPVTTISSIEVSIGNTYLVPIAANYTVSGNQLTLVNGVSATNVYVRYLTASNYALQVTPNSIPLSSLAAVGNYDDTSFLRADGSWSRPGIPQNLQSSAYTATADDAGFHILMTGSGGDVTIPTGLYNGWALTVINYLSAAGSFNVVPAVGVTFVKPGTGSVPSIPLAQYNIATVLCVNGITNTFLVTGQGSAF